MQGHDELSKPPAWVERWAPLIPHGRALDLACGGGRHARLLLSLGHEVLAVDREPQSIPGARFLRADLEDGSPWPLPGERFQGIVVTNYLHRPLFPLIEGALVPGGVLIYDTDHVYETTVKINKLLEQNNLQTYDLVICIDIMKEGTPELIASIKSGAVAWPSVILLGKRIGFANDMGQLVADAKNNLHNLSYVGEEDNVDILLKTGSSL